MKLLVVLACLLFWNHTYSQKIVEVHPFQKVKEGVYNLKDTNSLYNILDLCPERLFDRKLTPSSVQISLPSAGGFEMYDIFKTNVLKPSTSVRFPGIRSYFARSVNNPGSVAYITFSPGINSITFDEGEGVKVLTKNNQTQEYVWRQFPLISGETNCIEERSMNYRTSNAITSMEVRSCATYFITVAFTATAVFSESVALEYNIATPSVYLTMSKLVSFVNNELNYLYGKEVGVVFDLAEDQEDVIFLGSDPFVGDARYHSTINYFVYNNNINDPDCKMGMVLTKFQAGTSILGYGGDKICSDTFTRNAAGYYKDNNKVDLFTVLHEVGHVLGASHVINSTNCIDVQTNETAIEPYGGYSIMGYPRLSSNCWIRANIETGNGLGFDQSTDPNPGQSYFDVNFHLNAVSVKQILTRLSTNQCLNTIPGTCPPNFSATANTPDNIVIPRGTSFSLRGNSLNHNNNLYYQFNQVDNGQISSFPPDLNNPSIPLTPSARASNHYNRFFRGSMHLDSNQHLSNVGRNMQFNYLKREIINGIGFNDIRYKSITVDGSKGPLTIEQIDYQNDYHTTLIDDFNFSAPHSFVWNTNNTALMTNGKLLDIYLIPSFYFNFELFSFRSQIDSSNFYLIAKDIPNTGSYQGRIFFNEKIKSGDYHLVLMSKDKSFFTFSHSKIRVKPQLIFPNGGEVLYHGDTSIRTYFIPGDNVYNASSTVRTGLYLDINDGSGYQLIAFEDGALSSMRFPTSSAHISPQCKVKVEFTNGPGGPVIETLESADYFSIIDRIPSLSFNMEDFTRLNGLSGTVVVPAINGVFKGCSITSNLQDELSNFGEPADYTGLPTCIPGETFYGIPRPKSYSRTAETHLTDIDNQVQINSTYLNQRITRPFLLNYTITTSTTMSNDISFEFCNMGVDGPCPIYGISYGGTCFPSTGCYDSDFNPLFTDYYCKPGIFQITSSLNNYKVFHQNLTPSHSAVFAHFEDIIPSKYPVLISPNGYEQLEAGGFMLVSWFNPFFQPDNYAAVDIFTSIDNGITYKLIASAVPSTNMINSYKIRIPATNLSAGNSCKVKVTMRGDLYRTPTPYIDLSDESDSAFSIIPDVAYNLGVVPVTLLSFTGETVDLNNELKWTTSNEINVEKFEVERSLHGQAFERIGTVVSRNTPGNHNYFHLDRNAPEMAFYRLKIIDLDGTYAYSEIVQLSRRLRPVFSMNPNPVVHQLNLSGLEPGGRVELLTIDGKRLQSVPVLSQYLQLQMGNYPSGTYLVRYLKPNGEIISSKLIKH